MISFCVSITTTTYSSVSFFFLFLRTNYTVYLINTFCWSIISNMFQWFIYYSTRIINVILLIFNTRFFSLLIEEQWSLIGNFIKKYKFCFEIRVWQKIASLLLSKFLKLAKKNSEIVIFSSKKRYSPNTWYMFLISIGCQL